MDGGFLQETVSFVQIEPHYNTRHSGNQPGSDHDGISEQEMLDIFNFCIEAMTPGNDTHIFCLNPVLRMEQSTG